MRLVVESLLLLCLSGGCHAAEGDSCAEARAVLGAVNNQLRYPHATSRQAVTQGACSSDTILNDGHWRVMAGDGLNWTLSIENDDTDDFDYEIAILKGDCSQLECVAFDNGGGNKLKKVVWTAVQGTSYYLFIAGTSASSNPLSFARPSQLTTADPKSACQYSVTSGERTDFKTSCTCDDQTLVSTCEDSCESCLNSGQDCGMFRNERQAWDATGTSQSTTTCYSNVDGVNEFCVALHATSCEVRVNDQLCTSCSYCPGGGGSKQVCADCNNLQAGATINEADGTGLVGIFDNPIARRLYDPSRHLAEAFTVGACTTSVPTRSPTPAPTPAPTPTSSAPTTRWTRWSLAFSIVGMLWRL